MPESFDKQLRELVAKAIALGITKTAIAKEAGFERARFITWTNNPDTGFTMDTAERIRLACIRLIEGKAANE